jgi:predicted amidohydrolase
MAQTYRVAGAQLWPQESVAGALRKVLEAIRWAGEENADFVVTPEMYLSGYHPNFDPDEVEAAIGQVADACREAGVVTLLGTGHEHLGVVTNQARVIGSDGALVGFHEKMVLTPGEAAWSEPGRRLHVFEARGLRFGALLCNDFWVTPMGHDVPDPRLVAQLGEMGARVVFHLIASGPGPDYLAWHDSNHLLRARAARVFVVAANWAMEPESNVTSGVIAPDGKSILEVSRVGEQLFAADIEVE